MGNVTEVAGVPVFEDGSSLCIPPHEGDTRSTKDYLPDGALDFIRPTLLQCDETEKLSRDLRATLEAVDEELTHIAQCCGALLLDHTWGMLSLSQNPKTRAQRWAKLRSMHAQTLYKHYGVEAEFTLAARVPLLDDIEPIDDEHEIRARLEDDIDNYYLNAPVNSLGVKLSDMHAEQFVLGSPIRQPAQRCLWLVDIEPRIYIHPS